MNIRIMILKRIFDTLLTIYVIFLSKYLRPDQIETLSTYDVCKALQCFLSITVHFTT